MNRFPDFGKKGESLKKQFQLEDDELLKTATARAQKQIEVAQKLNALIVTYNHPLYPTNVFENNSPIPVLYVRGDAEVLKSKKTVACVGSRKNRPPFSQWHAKFAECASVEGFALVSGFAIGA